jgi:hypothetical protein
MNVKINIVFVSIASTMQLNYFSIKINKKYFDKILFISFWENY